MAATASSLAGFLVVTTVAAAGLALAEPHAGAPTSLASPPAGPAGHRVWHAPRQAFSVEFPATPVESPTGTGAGAARIVSTSVGASTFLLVYGAAGNDEQTGYGGRDPRSGDPLLAAVMTGLEERGARPVLAAAGGDASGDTRTFRIDTGSGRVVDGLLVARGSQRVALFEDHPAGETSHLDPFVATLRFP